MRAKAGVMISQNNFLCFIVCLSLGLVGGGS